MQPRGRCVHLCKLRFLYIPPFFFLCHRASLVSPWRRLVPLRRRRAHSSVILALGLGLVLLFGLVTVLSRIGIPIQIGIRRYQPSLLRAISNTTDYDYVYYS